MKKEKCTKDSVIIISRILLPEDANPVGIVHGGVVMKEIDNAAGVVAVRHTRKVCVTASIDRMDFHNPAYIGNLLTIKAGVNMTGHTSMEVGARVEAEDLLSGIKTHIASAYLTFVAIGKDKRPTQIPPLKAESKEEIRRGNEAKARRELRLSEKRKEKN